MKDFVLTPRAELDLTEIWEYIAQDNIDAADRVLDELEKMMYKLAAISRAFSHSFPATPTPHRWRPPNQSGPQPARAAA